jgi:GT2 family glycosyltransferase
MASIISMAVFDTLENKRSEYTERTLKSILNTVDLYRHKLVIIDNNSCFKTKSIFSEFIHNSENDHLNVEVITLPENIGTARAINKAWKLREPGQNCIKMDNDVVINQSGWVEAMEEAIERDPKIGIVGLKRKDLAEHPESEISWYKSALYFLAHEPGQSWIPFEEVQHVMGTCQMYNSVLLDKIGYLNQPGIYGFDDSLASFRARVAGFITGFLPHVQIDHIDVGDNPYIQVKRDLAGAGMDAYNKLIQEYANGTRPVYYED